MPQLLFPELTDEDAKLEWDGGVLPCPVVIDISVVDGPVFSALAIIAQLKSIHLELETDGVIEDTLPNVGFLGSEVATHISCSEAGEAP